MVSSGSASALRGTAEEQDQNKYGEWERQDPPNLIPAQGTPPLSSTGLPHVQGAACFLRQISSPNFARV